MPRCALAMTFAVALCLVACGGSGESPRDADDGRMDAAADLHTHLRNTFTGQSEKIAAGYGETVWLADGHRFLQPDFGLVEAGETRAGREVSRERYVGAIAEFFAEAQLPSQEQVDEFLKPAVLKASPPERGDGDRLIEREGRQLRFNGRKGDIFVRLFSRPETKDFVVYQMRNNDGRWLVVGEFTE